MCQEDSLFYLSYHGHKHKPGSYWYKKLLYATWHPYDRQHDEEAYKRWLLTGQNEKKKNNHSARKTQVQTLCATGVADSVVMLLSGHKSVQSLNQYKRPSLEQKPVSFFQ